MYIKLFIDFFTIGMMCFGGGYSVLPFFHSMFIRRGLITQSEFVDMIAISQITPGPIGANLTSFTAFRIAGIPGAFVATTALVIPGIMLAFFMLFFYKRLKDHILDKIFYGLRAAATGLIIAAAFNIMLITVFGITDVRKLAANFNAIDIRSLIITLVCLLLIHKKMNYIFIILLSGVAGYFIF